MTSLTFYGGVGEIGGNKILLRDENTSIFLDFGKNFERERRFYDEPKENKDYDCKHYESCSISRYEQNVHASESKHNKE
jgi:mRNA degradation ribonuclease J1/J2